MNSKAKSEKDREDQGYVPPGMTRADTDVDDYPQWDFANGSLAGTVIKVKMTEQIRRGEAVDVRLAVVEDDSGRRHLLWESANLSDFFDNIDAGQDIYIRQTGEVALSGNRTMKLYDAYYS